jgi:hypothetical protein
MRGYDGLDGEDLKKGLDSGNEAGSEAGSIGSVMSSPPVVGSDGGKTPENVRGSGEKELDSVKGPESKEDHCRPS